MAKQQQEISREASESQLVDWVVSEISPVLKKTASKLEVFETIGLTPSSNTNLRGKRLWWIYPMTPAQTRVLGHSQFTVQIYCDEKHPQFVMVEIGKSDSRNAPIESIEVLRRAHTDLIQYLQKNGYKGPYGEGHGDGNVYCKLRSDF